MVWHSGSGFNNMFDFLFVKLSMDEPKSKNFLVLLKLSITHTVFDCGNTMLDPLMLMCMWERVRKQGVDHSPWVQG